MRKLLKSTAAILLTLTLAVGNTGALQERWNITENKTITQVSKKYEGYTYGDGLGEIVFEQDIINKAYNLRNNYTITMKKNGKKKILKKGVESGIITNGKELYYTKYKNGKFYMYCMKLSTQKSKKVFSSSKQYVPYNKYGWYLYYSLPGWETEDRGDTIFVYDLKTKKKKHLADGIGFLKMDSKRIFLKGITGDESEVPIYCAKLDGSHKKKIGKGIDCFIYKKHIYWVKAKYINSEMYYRLKKCDMNYKNEKYVTKWISANKLPNDPYSNNGFKKYFIKHYLKK